MTAAVALEIVVKASLVAGTALALVLSLRRLPAARRAAVAHLGLLGVALMPVLVLAGPDLELSGFWSRAVAASPVAAVAAGPASPAIAAGGALAGPGAAQGPGVEALPFLIWAAGAGLLTLGLLLGLVRLFRLQREAVVLTDREWLGALAQAQHRMGVKHGTALLCSRRLTSPVSWGLLRPTIVLSPAALDAPERAEAILAHELAHVVRMDWANLLVARAATALFWFNPLVWILARHAHELREEAADDVVLRGEVDGPDYASLLVAFARDCSRGPALAAHGVAPGKGSLRRRLVRVLDRQARREPAGAVWVASCTLAAAAIAVPLAAFTPVDRLVETPPSAPIRAFPASPVTPAAATGEAGAATPGETADAAVARPEPTAERSPASQTVPAPAPDGRLSPEVLGQMRLHGVTPEWIASLEPELPWIRRLSGSQLAGLASQRVTAPWVRGLRQAGYGDLGYDQLMTLAAHRIDGSYVRQLAEAGLAGLSFDQLVWLKIQGVDADYVRRMQAAGVRIDPALLAAGRPRHGPPPAPPPAPAWPPGVPAPPGAPTPPGS